MKKGKSILAILLPLMTILILLVACAKPYHFYVKYDFPESSDGLKGQKVTLQVLDGRDSKIFLSEKANNEFDMWDGKFAMYHSPKKPEGEVQTYPLTGLIEAAMKKRLQSMGITVVQEKMDKVPVFQLTLNKLSLDLSDRTWVSDFSYEAKLTLDDQKTGREKVSGQAERTKVMGRGAGEILMGDIFTESINKLNIKKLFVNAGIEM
jgi:hypothetical protein